jgi:hypothetical protein
VVPTTWTRVDWLRRDLTRLALRSSDGVNPDQVADLVRCDLAGHTVKEFAALFGIDKARAAGLLQRQHETRLR